MASVNGQVVEYDGAEPVVAEGDVPANQDLPALAYSKDGSGPLIEWLVDEHRWNIPVPEPEPEPEPTGVFGGEEGIFTEGGGIFTQ